MTLENRFLKYVSFDTQSDENSDTYPSTLKQSIFLKALADEMRQIGLSDVEMDNYGYVMGTIPASAGLENAPVIGFISHVDTSPEISGKDVNPQKIENYDGGDIRLNDTVTMRVEEFPELSFFKGHTLIHTDGTTLLGGRRQGRCRGDNDRSRIPCRTSRCGTAKSASPSLPDEEIGRGVDYFDVKAFGADFAYTVDGGFEGELEYENFNAAGAKIHIQGRNIHPGYAKDKMINAIQVAFESQFDAAFRAAPRAYRRIRRLLPPDLDFGKRGAVRHRLHYPRPRPRKVRAEKKDLLRKAVEKAQRDLRCGLRDDGVARPVLQYAADGRTAHAGD
ncbi:MAG: tripeptide aminopeptidase PepT [Alistipes putredinis]|nr:MAG: tripeptide aminopeptidase PepT [Alistipes putredinis]